MSDLNLDRLRSVLDYSPSLGLFKWRVARGRSAAGSVAGYTNQHGYVWIGVDGAVYAAHRLAWFFTHGSWPDKQIDHINGCRHDNRICNLRDVDNRTNAENKRTATCRSNSGSLGVSWYASRGCWVAKVCVDGRNRHVGYFASKSEAARAYLEAKRRAHSGCTI